MRVSFCILMLCLYCVPLWAQTETRTEKLTPKTITGKVVDQDDEPVDAAIVKIWLSTLNNSAQRYEKLSIITLTTDNQGEFGFEVKKAPAKNSKLLLNVTSFQASCICVW